MQTDRLPQRTVYDRLRECYEDVPADVRVVLPPPNFPRNLLGAVVRPADGGWYDVVYPSGQGRISARMRLRLLDQIESGTLALVDRGTPDGLWALCDVDPLRTVVRGLPETRSFGTGEGGAPAACVVGYDLEDLVPHDPPAA